MIEIKSNGKVDARKLHKFVIQDAKGGQKGEDFSNWMKRMLEYGFEKGQDYTVIEYNYTGAKISESGNQRVAKRDYELTIDCAKEISMIQRNDKGKQLRKYFISIQTDRQELDTLTHDEVVNLSKRIEAFKYEDNQKLIEKMHKEKYVASGKGNYADFNISRNNVLNIHKDKIDNAIKEYCVKNNRKMPNLKSKHDKIQFIDEHKNLKHAIWDSLEIQNEKHSLKLANLGERMAKALGIKTKRKNENNLFELKEDINIKGLMIAAKKIKKPCPN